MFCLDSGGVVEGVDAEGCLGSAAHFVHENLSCPADPSQARHSAGLRHQQAQVRSANHSCIFHPGSDKATGRQGSMLIYFVFRSDLLMYKLL